MPTYLKMTAEGGQGAGKTATAALLVLGISVEQCNKAPVLAFDSEPGLPFYLPIFAREGVKLEIRPGRSYKQLLAALRESIRLGCCAFVGDSLTHPWTDLVQSFADSNGLISMAKQGQLRRLWNEFTQEWIDAPLHSIGCGRLSWEYLDVLNESGQFETVRGDSRFKAGGSESFGYEAHLQCELRASQGQERQNGKSKNRRPRKSVSHVCTVLKDRTWALNDQVFNFRNLPKDQPGIYALVYKAFLPHLKALEATPGLTIGKATSRDLLVSGESMWAKEQRERTIAIEKFEGEMDLLWAGRDAKSIRARAVVGHAITGTLSRTEMEHSLSLAELKSAAMTVQALRERVAEEGFPPDEKALLVAVGLAKEDIQGCHARCTTTLASVLQRSIALRQEEKKNVEAAQAAKPTPASQTGD